MRKFFLFIFLVANVHAFSQTMSISGNVQDTVAKMPLKNAVAMAIRIKDSVLLAHTRTDPNGFFTLNNIALDTIQIIISHTQFSDQSYYLFGSASNHVFDFGKIILPPKSQQLKEVIIYAYKDPVYYKGDTLIYSADSFKVKANATVEDLLKKLPGIQVDAQGKIKSQGKEVSQVLVDGDEFFGTDPTVATKNLAASGVESVQVYEKKNENSSDGANETLQVMNLKLKDDAKKGYFGKATAASDFQKFYEGEFLANKFSKSQKISVFVLGSNTPRSSFGWGDVYKYGLDNEMDNFMNEDGEMMYWNNNQNQNQGIPQTLKSGFYYNDKIGKKTKLGFNYSYSNNQLNVEKNSRSQYFFPDTNYVTDNKYVESQKLESHVLNFKLTQTIDSLTELEVEPRFKLNKSTQANAQLTRFFSQENLLTRTTDRENANEANGYDINTNVKLNRKFKKRDRFLRLTYNLTANDNEADGLLQSFDTTYATVKTFDIVDQKKMSTSINQVHNAMAVYTEPLTKKIKLEFEYNYTYSFGTQDKRSKNSLNGEYILEDSLFSNSFQNKRLTNRFGGKFIYETNKHAVYVGTRLRNVTVDNKNLITDKVINQSVNNVLPYLTYNYKFNQGTRLNFRYTTSSAQPTINQLQPIPDNSNPNQIKEGNPDLLPTFSNNFNLSFNSYKPVSGKYVWASANYSITNDAFANDIRYDSLGRAISKTLNVNGNTGGSLYVGGGLPLLSKKIMIRPDVNVNYSSYVNYINSQENITKTRDYSTGLGFDLNLDTLTFSVSYNLNYSQSSSSLSSVSNQPYFQHRFYTYLLLKLPFKFYIETDAQYTINSQRTDGYNINYLIWNASVNKTFLKNENLIMSLSGNDILNQNISVDRQPEDNVITDVKTTIISRYFLLKLTYKFNSTKTKENDDYF